MTVEVGDTIQYRNGPVSEVIVVTSQIAVVRDDDGKEHAYHLDAFEGSDWSVNGKRIYPPMDGWYMAFMGGTNYLSRTSDLGTAWEWYTQDHKASGVIGIVDHG